MKGTYVVHAKTAGSTLSIMTDDPADAIRRALDMAGPRSAVTITDYDGNPHSLEELEANVLSGTYARPASARPASSQQV